jgi:two-component sensor histidine kinase
MGFFVFLKNPSASLNRWFFFVALGLAVWSFGHVFHDPSSKMFGGYFLFPFSVVGAFLYVPFLVRFISGLTDFPRNNRFKRWIFRIAFLYALLLVVYLLTNPEKIDHVFFINWFENSPSNSLFTLGAFFFFLLTNVLIIFSLLIWRKGMRRPAEIAQFRFIFYPLIVSLFFSFLSDLILPMGSIWGINHLSHIYSIFWLGGVAYGVLRLRFFALTPSLAAEQVIGQTRQVLLFCDLQGRVTKTNAFTAGLLQLRSKEMEGKKVIQFFAEERELENYLEWATSNGFSGPAEISLRSSRGEYIAVNVSFSLVKDAFDDVLGLMVYGQDNRESIKLRNEILIRQQIENKLRSLSEVLEARVKERTDQLANSYKELQVKMTERLKVEEKIKSDIAEKEVLINEIHNRVKNNMNLIIALINAQISKENPRKVNQKFRELAQRVRAILLVHHHLYLSLNYSEVDFSGFLRLLVSQLIDFYPSDEEVSLELNLSEVFLDIDHAIPLGIIVNELISNALAHAFQARGRRKEEIKPPLLAIDFFQEEGFCHLRIKDNGKGLPKKFDFHNGQTNGLSLVDVLVSDQVSGQLEIQSKEGTQIKIIFPLAASSLSGS